MFRLPGEFEKQTATIFLFPYRKDIWRGEAKPIQQTIVDLANIVVQYEPVYLGVLPELKEYLLTSANNMVRSCLEEELQFSLHFFQPLFK